MTQWDGGPRKRHIQPITAVILLFVHFFTWQTRDGISANAAYGMCGICYNTVHEKPLPKC